MRVGAVSMTYLRKPWNVPGAGRSGVDHGGDARLEADGVGIDVQGDAVLVDVGVDVDQSWRDDLAFGVVDLPRLARRNARRDPRDAATGNRHVALGREVLRRINDPAAGDEEVVNHASSSWRWRSRRLSLRLQIAESRSEHRRRAEPFEKHSSTGFRHDGHLFESAPYTSKKRGMVSLGCRNDTRRAHGQSNSFERRRPNPSRDHGTGVPSFDTRGTPFASGG